MYRAFHRLAVVSLLALFAAGCRRPAAPDSRDDGAHAGPGVTHRLRDGEARVELNGVEHWYRVAGARHPGPPLVIVHGGPGGNVYAFERTIGPELEAFAPVVYYEQRGSGRSAPPRDPLDYSIPTLVSDLEALRRHLGLEAVAPLGFSFGGELALEYALAHPERVAKLVLQAPSNSDDRERSDVLQLYGFAAVAEGEDAGRVRGIVRGPGDAGERLGKVWDAVSTATVDRLLFRDQAAARRNRALWEESRLENTGQMHKALRQKPPNPTPLLERARRLAPPALALVGLYDRNVGVDPVRDLVTAMPRAELVTFAKSAHFPDIEEPVAYAAAVKRFLRD